MLYAHVHSARTVCGWTIPVICKFVIGVAQAYIKTLLSSGVYRTYIVISTYFMLLNDRKYYLSVRDFLSKSLNIFINLKDLLRGIVNKLYSFYLRL